MRAAAGHCCRPQRVTFTALDISYHYGHMLELSLRYALEFDIDAGGLTPYDFARAIQHAPN